VAISLTLGSKLDCFTDITLMSKWLVRTPSTEHGPEQAQFGEMCPAPRGDWGGGRGDGGMLTASAVFSLQLC
jgi:hypothetical protein